MSSPLLTRISGAVSRPSARSAAPSWLLLTVTLLLFIGIVCISQVVTWISISYRGLDTTDEGYYLNVISQPASEVGTVLWFGAVLHVPWLLLGQSVAALRLFGAAVTVSLGGVLAHESISFTTRTQRTRWSRAVRWTAILGTALTSLLVYAQGPLTPSYNTVALWGLCLASAGLLRWSQSSIGKSLDLGSPMVGLGIALVALSKPTSALALIVVSVAVILLGRLAQLSRILKAVGSSTLLFALVLATTHLSPVEFVERTRVGVTLAEVLGGHAQMFRWDGFYAPKVPAVASVILLLGAVAASLLVANDLPGLGLSTVAVACVGALIVVRPVLSVDRALNVPYVMTVGWVLPGAVAAQLLVEAFRASYFARSRKDNEPPKSLYKVATLSCMLFVMPLVHAFGTNNNYWRAQPRAGVFWVCAGLIVLSSVWRNRPQATLSHVVTGVVFTLFMSTVSVLAPYRAESFARDTTATVVGNSHARILLPPSTSAHLFKLRASFRAAGATSRTHVLDLTGESPGYVFAMGATPAGQGWVLGGYPGSTAAASRLAQYMGCRAVASSWLLTSKDGLRSIGGEPLTAVGLNQQRDYESVAEIPRVADGRARSSSEGQRILLLRPKASAQRVCAAAGR